jgi:hypothetical protein
MKIDPYTNEQFEPARTNQRFASAKNRITYHNLIARDKRMITREIDYSISSNWNILLKQLAGKDKVVRTREFLLGAGFNFSLFQRAYREDSEVIYRIYNCGFFIADDTVTIIKIEL